MASRGKLDDCFERLDASGVDADLIAIAKHCLEMEPGDRPRDAGALSEKITNYLESVEARLRATERQRAAEAARADESRKRARVTMALAATVLLAVTLGGGGWVYVEQQSAEHLTAATANINERLSDARLHQQLAGAVDVSSDTGLKERARELSVALENARDAAKQAEAAEILSDLRTSSSKLLVAIKSEFQTAERVANEAAANRELKQKLELIRISRAAGGDSEPEEPSPNVEVSSHIVSDDGAVAPMMAEPVVDEPDDFPQLYRQAFQQAGLDLLSDDPKEAITWIQQSPIRETLISAIDDWIRASSEVLPPELESLTWSVPTPTDTIAAGATLQLQPDDSILAGPPAGPEDDHYTIVLQPNPGPVSALRLEMLTDDSLPNGGPGHHQPSGNFHLHEFKVFLRREDQSQVPLPIADAWASYSWEGRHISQAVDGDLNTAWHVWSQIGQPHQAVFLLESPFEITAGQALVVELHQQHEHALGRFRLAATGDTVRVHSNLLRNLVDLVDQADYSEWRKQLRVALASDDLENLKELATADEAKEQQPTLIAWLGRSLRQRGAVEQAVTVLHDAQLKHPGDLELNLELGQALLRTRDRKAEALGYLRSAVALRPQSLVTLEALRNAVDDHKQFDEWLELSRRIARLDPKDAGVHCSLGYVLDSRGMMDEAITAYRKAIELDPKFVLAHNNLGVVFLSQKKLVEAIVLFRKAIELDPTFPNAHSGLGKALLQQGEVDKGLAEIRKASELDPLSAARHYTLGHALNSQGKIVEAITAYRKVIEVDPKYAVAHNNLGNALQAQGKFVEAIAEHRKAIELDHSTAGRHNNLGVALKKHGKWDEAMTEFRKAIELDPTHAGVHLNLGNALTSQGEVVEAIAAYRKSIELEPSFEGHSSLGNALTSQGKLDEAIAEHLKAIELGPTIAEVHQNLGEALHKNVALGQAKEECQRVIALYDELITVETREGEWLTNRAMAYMALQQWEPAKADWLRAIELDPKQLQRVFESYKQVERQSDAVEVRLQYTEAKPNNDRRWMEVAPVLVLAGQRKDYAAFCQRAVEQFSDTAKPEVSERITKSMLLLPDAIEPDKLPTLPLIHSLENETATADQQPWFWTTRALLAYRTGDAESAAQYATRSQEHKPIKVTRALALSVLALAQHKQGNTAEATTALHQATQQLEDLEQNTTGYDADLQIAKVLHREAEAKINGVTEASDAAATGSPEDKPSTPSPESTPETPSKPSPDKPAPTPSNQDPPATGNESKPAAESASDDPNADINLAKAVGSLTNLDVSTPYR